jgi:cytochrome c553
VIALLLMSVAADPALVAGQMLYQEGRGTPRPAMFLGGSVVAAPGHALPCSGCHGTDGTPVAENRATPSLQQLARTARDPALFRAALESGRGADGHMLQLMPRYQFTQSQREGLARYVTSLATGQAFEPGVDDNSIMVNISGLRRAQQDMIRAQMSGRDFYGRTVRFGSEGFITISTIAGGPRTVDFRRLEDVALAFSRTGRVLTRAGFFAALDAVQREGR